MLYSKKLSKNWKIIIICFIVNIFHYNLYISIYILIYINISENISNLFFMNDIQNLHEEGIKLSKTI